MKERGLDDDDFETAEILIHDEHNIVKGGLLVRQGFNVKLKLDPDEKLKVGAEYQGWKRVTTTLHNTDISGWVRDKYITETCEKTRTSSDEPAKPESKPELADDPNLADWCRRNDPSSSTQSCANLRSSPVKEYPNWLLNDPPAVKALRP
jgi:hypothetical protein